MWYFSNSVSLTLIRYRFMFCSIVFWIQISYLFLNELRYSIQDCVRHFISSFHIVSWDKLWQSNEQCSSDSLVMTSNIPKARPSVLQCATFRPQYCTGKFVHERGIFCFGWGLIKFQWSDSFIINTSNVFKAQMAADCFAVQFHKVSSTSQTQHLANLVCLISEKQGASAIRGYKLNIITDSVNKRRWSILQLYNSVLGEYVYMN